MRTAIVEDRDMTNTGKDLDSDIVSVMDRETVTAIRRDLQTLQGLLDLLDLPILRAQLCHQDFPALRALLESQDRRALAR